MRNIMTAAIIDGKQLSAHLRNKVQAEVAIFLTQFGRPPCLAVVLVGEDPASQVYVRNKKKQTVEVGMRSVDIELPATTSEAELLKVIFDLNADDGVDGILVQLPVPKHINADEVIAAIDPAKDVDGFHPLNVGQLMIGNPRLVPCTPLGCLLMAHTVYDSLAGVNAVVIGRSNIVGKPMAQLLLSASATVTIAHSRTKNIQDIVRGADLVVAAVGQPEMVKGDWIKPGAVVLDVGINRIQNADGTSRLVGDVAFSEAQHARAITPVPGGVGPMTIACLLWNTLTAAQLRRGGVQTLSMQDVLKDYSNN